MLEPVLVERVELVNAFHVLDELCQLPFPLELVFVQDLSVRQVLIHLASVELLDPIYLPGILVAPSDKVRLAKAEAEAMDQSGPSSYPPAMDQPSPNGGSLPASPWCYCLPDVIMSWGCLDVASVF